MSHEPAPTFALAAGRIHYAGLDGLRAIAVAAVLVYHLFPRALPGGFIGVDVFFVISGFLITSLLLREKASTGRVDLRSFWGRRARRILPALVIVVTASTTAALLVGGDVLVRIGRQILGAATFSYNWVAVAGGGSYFDQLSPEMFRTLWSLAVEEQFYIVWPLLLLALLFVRSRWARAAVLVVAAAGSAIWMATLFMPGGDATRVYYGTDTHAFGLLIGAALAVLLEGRLGAGLPRAAGRATRIAIDAAGTAALVGIGVAMVVLGDAADATYRGGLAVASVLTVVVIAAAIRPDSRLGARLDAGALRWMGRRSYGIYLWHWPIFTLLLAGAGGATSQAPPLAASVLAVLITLVVAELSFRFAENPVRRRGFAGCVRAFGRAVRTRTPRTIVAASTALVLVALAGSTLTAIAVAPQKSTVEALIAHARQAAHTRSVAPSAQPSTRPTVTGDNITAVGDSVMLAAAPALQEAFPGIDVDAKVSRSMYAAPGILRRLDDEGRLRGTVVLGLGTNGPISKSTLADVARVLGPQRQLVLVSAFAPRDWIAGVNAELGDFASRHRTTVLADWCGDIEPRSRELLAGDGIHPGEKGGEVYAKSIAAALQALADLPPAAGTQHGHNLPVAR
ncbi:Peptidoglycan/LPS O-acetylase OafA/YrhL, contains acyltransferase and SGNH-hydrolase domains [Paramicrobacterium humi]|uniref:Peptidoglycan/LPS O-acetylase OafA/YrhL, contains acyltransferase and SGNH-hydrolase domains n=1 Tax=Paramicrobacterium humi TaxID=640635 RepID=A0A1H4J018_9MICO|nr:acyltransferase family protein [Microbacterium humi]SEB39591.1 Peptidoglycan/LPS O-acetylase OafA/YrhL, contains acyltransferase and SGNH-hydrolase domains [Microbacterium humi]